MRAVHYLSLVFGTTSLLIQREFRIIGFICGILVIGVIVSSEQDMRPMLCSSSNRLQDELQLKAVNPDDDELPPELDPEDGGPPDADFMPDDDNDDVRPRPPLEAEGRYILRAREAEEPAAPGRARRRRQRQRWTK